MKGEHIMENQVNGNQFRDEEIVIMSHWDKNKEEWVRTVYPKIGDRLRLAHEEIQHHRHCLEVVGSGEIGEVLFQQ